MGVGFLVFDAAPALAWNGPGHMLIADITWAQLVLVPAAHAALTKTLKGAKGDFKPKGNKASDIRDALDFASTIPRLHQRARRFTLRAVGGPMNLTFWPHHTPPGGREGVRCRSWHYYDTPIRFTSTTSLV